MKRPAALVIIAVLSGCAQAPPTETPGQEPAGEELYETTASVLEGNEHGPMLCLGAVLESLPPQCGDVPITNWDWDAVEGEERLSGTTWGQFRVVGTYDGEAFTVTEAGPPGPSPDPLETDPIEAGCPEPEGGWPWPDPDRASEEDLIEAQRVAQTKPDFAGLWIDELDRPNPGAPSDARQIVVSAAFTGDLDRHEAELREVWGGPLCMVEHPRSYRDLKGIQKELGGATELGLHVLYSDIAVVEGVVQIHVVVLDDEARRALEERYGQGTVRATAALKPVSGA